MLSADVLSEDVSTTGTMGVQNSLAVPQFDPSLGTLNSVVFTFNADATLTWQWASNNGGGFTDYTVPDVSVSFLNADILFGGGPVDGPFPDPLFCGPAYASNPPFSAPTCSPVTTHLDPEVGWLAGIRIPGTLVGNSVTLTPGMFPGPPGISFPFGSPSPVSVSDFVGGGILSLPVETDLTGALTDGFAESDNGGRATLTSIDNPTWDLSLQYDYTPAPEPHMYAFLACVVAAIAIAAWRRAASPEVEAATQPQ
ncbi:MAG TPA: choice-of-anchor E domain-containing protein [Bryobacteraceae bacterium]|nr:choice-of-anchor E domain-containing protein [Bryobacteraceae bacterium]